MAVKVTASICAVKLPYWLGISLNSSQWLFIWTNDMVRHSILVKQANWQSVNFDAKMIVENEQPGLVHWYRTPFIRESNNVWIFCESDCAMMIISSRSKTNKVFMLSKRQHISKWNFFLRKKKVESSDWYPWQMLGFFNFTLSVIIIRRECLGLSKPFSRQPLNAILAELRVLELNNRNTTFLRIEQQWKKQNAFCTEISSKNGPWS